MGIYLGLAPTRQIEPDPIWNQDSPRILYIYIFWNRQEPTKPQETWNVQNRVQNRRVFFKLNKKLELGPYGCCLEKSRNRQNGKITALPKRPPYSSLRMSFWNVGTFQKGWRVSCFGYCFVVGPLSLHLTPVTCTLGRTLLKVQVYFIYKWPRVHFKSQGKKP
jgi:hypothetical protein